jgi:XTP/dITP diphosphohydrolase
MGFPPRLVLATANPGKVREILEICADWPVQWVIDREASLPRVEESGSGYLENAMIKASSAARALGIPAVADDSGIEVDALGGDPGPRSARFAGPAATDDENLSLLIERIRTVPEDRRTARYRCVTVCAWPDGDRIWGEGTCTGWLVLEPRGERGFGYDPIFIPDGHRRTMAELNPEEKNAISHRGRALRRLRASLDLYARPAPGPNDDGGLE